MKWYRLLSSDEGRGEHWFHPAEAFFAGIPSAVMRTGRIHELISCREIENWDYESSFVRSDSADFDSPTDDVMYFIGDFPIFSSRLRKALDDASAGCHDIQYLPIRVLQSTGSLLDGFSVVNVLSKLKALNVAQSKFVDYDTKKVDPVTGKQRIAVVGKPVLSAAVNAFSGDMFRLAEYPPQLFVSERFAEVFRRGGYSGAELSPVAVV